MLPAPEINENDLFGQTLHELTADGNTEVSWEEIQVLLAKKITALGGDPQQAAEHIKQVLVLEKSQ